MVSHSRALAEAAMTLAEEMTDPDHRPAIRVAAGLDAQTFGTDAAAVSEAITEADSGDGVLVLLDLGSAVLSAEMALEFVDPQLAERVRVSGAPLVEGLVAAVVAAGAGADLETAAREAEQGLVAKAQHLSTDQGTVEAEPAQHDHGDGVDRPGRPGEGALTRVVPVSAPHGLHARPAARFVREVGSHPGVQVWVRNLDSGSGPVDGRSLTGIATLDARQGHSLEISASGPGAAGLLESLEALARSGFGDLAAPEGDARGGPSERPPSATDQATTTQTATAQTATTQTATGATFALEAAVGPAVLPAEPVHVEDYEQGDVAAELDALDRAVGQARRELTDLVARTTERVGRHEAAVFEAHLAILDDPALEDRVRVGIRAGESAPEALTTRSRSCASSSTG